MRINKLILEGKNYKRTLLFEEGLNIIQGDFMSGKSLVLELIKFCLGGKKEKMNKDSHIELFNYCDTLYLEITSNTQDYTIMRHLKKDNDSINLYICDFKSISNYVPKKYSVNDFCDFLYDLLNITKIFLMKNKQHSKEKIVEKMSFRDVFRYIYVPQHEFGTNNFLGSTDYFKKNKNLKTCEILLGLNTSNNEKNNSKLIELENSSVKNLKIIEGFKQHIENINVDEDELVKKLQKISEEIINLNEKKNELKSGNYKNKNSLFSELIKKKSELFNQKIKTLADMEEVKLSLTGNNILYNDYINEKKMVEATIEGIYNLKIDSHSEICPLCETKLEKKFNDQEDSRIVIEKMEKNIKEIEGKISLIKFISIRKEEKKRKLTSNLVKIENKIKEIEEKEGSYLNNSEIPFLNEIELLNETLRKAVENKGSLEEKIQYYNLIRKYKEKNEILKNEKENLNHLLDKKEQKKRKVIEEISKNFEKILENFRGLNKNLGEIKIDCLPYYNGASILKHTSGGLLSTLTVAYLGAISTFSEEHPKILMLDTIGKYLGTENKSEIKDKEMYEEIYGYLEKLSSEIQIILVDNTPPKSMDRYIKYTFHQGIEGGLINIKKNEY
ncbi:MAG: hypothetical protein ACRC6U_10635 [Fusobacteriaceae bacterium]